MGTQWESFEVTGENLLAKVKELIAKGNVRRIILKRKNHTLLEIPLNAGVAVTALTAIMAPTLVAVGAIAALVSEVTVVVQTDDGKPGTEEARPAAEITEKPEPKK